MSIWTTSNVDHCIYILQTHKIIFKDDVKKKKQAVHKMESVQSWKKMVLGYFIGIGSFMQLQHRSTADVLQMYQTVPK